MPDEPSLGELFRLVGDVKSDVRAVRNEMLRSDVYTANRAGDDIRIRTIEAKVAEMESDRATTRRLLYGALTTAAGSLVVQAVIAFAAAH